MNDDHQTQTVEAPAYLDDPKVLAYLKKVDADVENLFLDEESGKLWPYRISDSKQEHRQSLEDLVALAFPKYFQAYAVVVEQEQPAKPAMAEPELDMFARFKKAVADGKAVASKCRPIGFLAQSNSGGGNRIPRVKNQDGTKTNPRRIMVFGSTTTEVPLVTMHDMERVLVGFAVLPSQAYDRLQYSGANPDRFLWVLDAEGHPCTRVKRSQTDWFYQRIAELLGELGIPGEVSVRLLGALA